MTRALTMEVQPFWVLLDSTTIMARAVHSIRLWLPVTVLILFLMASCVTILSNVEGYSTPSDNAEKIGIIEGRVGNVEKQVETLPEQMAAMRERLVMVEQRSISTDTKLTMVLSGVWALFIGVFGILVNEILKRVRIGGSKAESGSVPTIGAGSSK